MTYRARVLILLSSVVLGCVVVGCGASPTLVEVVPLARPAPAPESAFVVDQGAEALLLGADDPLVHEGAVAHAGDLCLVNEHLQVLVAGVDHPAAGALRGGHIVGTAPIGLTAFHGAWVPILDVDGRVFPVLEAVTVTQDGAAGGAAIVRATGHDPRDPALGISVDYILAPGARHLRVITTVENRTRGHYKDYVLGHLATWGALQPLVPGAPLDLEGRRTHSDWVGADTVGSSVVMALETGRLVGVHGRGWSLLSPRPIYLRPGMTVTKEMHLFVAGAGGLSRAAAERLTARRAVQGRLVGTVREGEMGVSGARVVLVDRAGLPVGRALTDGVGEYQAALRPGTYGVVVEAPGRTATAPALVAIDTEVTATLDVMLPPPSVVALQITDEADQPLSGRVRLEAIEGTAPTRLGPSGGVRLEDGTWVAGGEVLLARGAGRVRVPPGTYRVIFDAGPAYEAKVLRVVLRAGRTITIPAQLLRRLDTRHWFALDPQVHTRTTPSATASLPARLEACRVQGLDGVVVTDEGRVTQVGAVDGLQVFGGLRASVPGVGRFSVFPVGSQVRVPQADRADTLLDALAKLPGAPNVTVLQPRATAGWGYFTHYGYDPQANTLPRGGFSGAFSAIEVGSPGPRGPVDHALGDYMAMLNRGVDIRPLGASGADGVAGEPCGLPRTWVRSKTPITDGPTLAQAIRAGDLVVSYGPLLDLWVDGVRPGAVAPKHGPRKADVRVQAPAWARPSVLRLVGDGRVLGELKLTGEGALDVRHQFKIPAGVHWVFALVDGPRDLGPITGRTARPLAFTTAVRLVP